MNGLRSNLGKEMRGVRGRERERERPRRQALPAVDGRHAELTGEPREDGSGGGRRQGNDG